MKQVYRILSVGAGAAPIYDMFVDSASDLPAGGIIDEVQAALGSSAIDVSTGATYRLNSSGVWINQSTGAKTIQITKQPENAEVTAGEDATFTVEATGYSLSYKWQSSSDGTTWTDISGATSATYTITTEASDNGKSYHCVITDGDSNSATSSAATLTVNEPEQEPDPDPDPEQGDDTVPGDDDNTEQNGEG